IPNLNNSGLGEVTFANLNAGDYPIWSALRLVSTTGATTAVANLINGAVGLDSTKSDFIPLTKLNAWHSHFNFIGLGITNNNNGETINPATPNDLCSVSTGEGGGDVGAMSIYKKANNDFCTDFNVPIGINDKNQ